MEKNINYNKYRVLFKRTTTVFWVKIKPQQRFFDYPKVLYSYKTDGICNPLTFVYNNPEKFNNIYTPKEIDDVYHKYGEFIKRDGEFIHFNKAYFELMRELSISKWTAYVFSFIDFDKCPELLELEEDELKSYQMGEQFAAQHRYLHTTSNFIYDEFRDTYINRAIKKEVNENGKYSDIYKKIGVLSGKNFGKLFEHKMI